MTRPSLLLFTACILVSGCTTKYEGDSTAKDPQGNDKVMYLYRIDVDQEALAGGAALLFDEPAPQTSYGLTRRCQGVFSVSDSGYCRIEVKVAEPVISLDGRRFEQVYTLLNFFGRASDDGERATTMSGEDVNVQSNSAADVVRFYDRGRNKISVQAFVGSKPTAYILHFHHSVLPRRDVPMPWRASQN